MQSIPEKKSGSKIMGHVTAFLSVLFFALNIPSSTYIMHGWLDPGGYTLVRAAGGLVVCSIISIFIKRQKLEKKKDLVVFILSGFLGLTLFFYFFALGMGHTSPIDSSIILTLPPVMVMIASIFVFREKLTGRKILGLCLALGGALMIILLQPAKGGHSGLLGNIYILISAVLYAGYLVYTKDVSMRYNPVILLRWLYLFAFIGAIPFCLKGLMHSRLILEPELTPVLVMSFIAIFPTAVGYLLISIAMKSLSSTIVSIYNYAIPIIASIVAIILKQATLHWDDPIACALVIVGVYFVNISRKKKIPAAPQPPAN